MLLHSLDEFGRTRSHSLPYSAAATAHLSAYAAVGFLPTTLPIDNAVPFAAPQLLARLFTYGLLSPARDAVLGFPDAARLVARACAELDYTGVATPFFFGVLALDVCRTAVARLVHAFLATFAEGAGARRGGTVCGRRMSWKVVEVVCAPFLFFSFTSMHPTSLPFPIHLLFFLLFLSSLPSPHCPPLSIGDYPECKSPPGSLFIGA
ncbi:hypothetical protein DFH09DRAFT_1316753 [Mycena vulgaris]|nr:hypothetical protein DFH09DRAFT_1316753 [Mycena vulgaris]